MDSGNNPSPYDLLAKQISDLTTTVDRKFGEINTTLTTIQVNIGRIDERTTSVGANSWKWATLIVSIAALAVAILSRKG